MALNLLGVFSAVWAFPISGLLSYFFRGIPSSWGLFLIRGLSYSFIKDVVATIGTDFAHAGDECFGSVTFDLISLICVSVQLAECPPPEFFFSYRKLFSVSFLILLSFFAKDTDCDFYIGFLMANFGLVVFDEALPDGQCDGNKDANNADAASG